jgi:hypothetical protein
MFRPSYYNTKQGKWRLKASGNYNILTVNIEEMDIAYIRLQSVRTDFVILAKYQLLTALLTEI